MTIFERIEKLGPGQKQTTIFSGTVQPLTDQVFLSPLFSRPIHVYMVRARFPLNQNAMLKLSFYVSLDNSEDTTLPLTGTNLLQQSSLTTYITGDDETKELLLDFWQFEGNAFLKVLAQNIDSQEHTLDVQISTEVF